MNFLKLGRQALASVKRLNIKCSCVEEPLVFVFLRMCYFRLHRLKILPSRRVRIKGVNNIETDGLVQIGMDYVGFMDRYDRTYLNVRGRLLFAGDFSVGKGCRFDVGRDAQVILRGGFVNANSLFVIHNYLDVGAGCAISWNCQFLDADLHEIIYEERVEEKKAGITLGAHVWVGNNVTFLKGAVIPNGCVICANSLVNKAFEEENVLIGGSPARILRRNIKWK